MDKKKTTAPSSSSLFGYFFFFLPSYSSTYLVRSMYSPNTKDSSFATEHYFLSIKLFFDIDTDNSLVTISFI
ncbi:hypothetical protein BJ944DRAFT_274327 [Cunninghamella echinulata]|nr:hypothetical protein BJ944DRAFT_274327 [Cunninghamella echinulata]